MQNTHFSALGRYFVFWTFIVMLSLAGCNGGCTDKKAADAEPATSNLKETTMKLTSTAFNHGKPIARKYTGEGTDVSVPLTWSGVPDGTIELALICDDPDAPRPEPWVHWVIYKIPAAATGLSEGLPRQKRLETPSGVLQGVNSWPSDNVGYRGPMPPPGHGVHHYHFRLYALDTALLVEPGLSKDKLLAAMAGHIICLLYTSDAADE